MLIFLSTTFFGIVGYFIGLNFQDPVLGAIIGSVIGLLLGAMCKYAPEAIGDFFEAIVDILTAIGK